MKVIKLKQMAKTFVFLEEHGYADMTELANAAADADYHKVPNEMRELLIHKANAEYILGIDEQKEQRKEYQYE